MRSSARLPEPLPSGNRRLHRHPRWSEVVNMRKPYAFFFIFLLMLSVVLASCTGSAERQKVTIYKSPSCGCCEVYTNYLESKGKYEVEVVSLSDVTPIAEKYGLPTSM